MWLDDAVPPQLPLTELKKKHAWSRKKSQSNASAKCVETPESMFIDSQAIQLTSRDKIPV
jgi:hypothetical protein